MDIIRKVLIGAAIGLAAATLYDILNIGSLLGL